jgi:hypothetical protein
MENGLANLSIQDESPTRPPLKFKSYKTGTLITNNGVPSEAFIAAFRLPEPAPVPSLKPSQLSATTPAFVPRTPQLAPTAPVNKVLPTPSTATPAFHRVQNLIHDMQSPTNADPSHQMVEQYNSFYTPPHSGPSSFHNTPDYQQVTPIRPPRIYYQRTEKSKKDIIITDTGVIRNAVKVVEQFLPNGSPYHDYTSEFDGPDYDFVAEFNAMTLKEKMDLLANKQVEILVKLVTYDGEENVEIVIVKKKGKKNKHKAKEGGASKADDVKGKGKEKEEVKQRAAEGGTSKPETTTVIDTINALGPDFANNTKSLYVTLDFTSIPIPADVTPVIPTGPRASPLSLKPNEPLSFGPNFGFITSLVRTLQSFTALKHMVINLRVLSAHNSRPVTIPQLTLVLPFYDLGFTEWKVSYQTEFFTTSVPVRDHDYPLKWLDRERNKILTEREKKIESTVFVRRSSVEGKVATWTRQK